MKGKSNCDYCIHYVFDEEYNCYGCQVDLDEDDMMRFMSRSFENCPYFRLNDEYKTVRKQM